VVPFERYYHTVVLFPEITALLVPVYTGFSVITYFFRTFYAGGGLGGDGYRYKKAFFEKLPIPHWNESILQKQIANSDNDENIDMSVIALYHLDKKEIQHINLKG
jgi:hypothetical protein